MSKLKLIYSVPLLLVFFNAYSQAISMKDHAIGAFDIDIERNLQLKSEISSIRLGIYGQSTIFEISKDNSNAKITSYGGGINFSTSNFPNSANTNLWIAGNGNIGISEPNPDAKLHINDGTDASLLGNGYILLGLKDDVNMILDDNEIMARDNGTYSSMFIQKDGGDLLLCGDEKGQVGIGITTAANLPNAEYLLAVDGKIATEDILVDPSENWPDYVFEDNYKLRSIKELEASILLNGHLPGIPSSQQIENEGQHLGEIQILLLEKIEELSLYIIQQNTMIVNHQEEIDRLKTIIQDK